VSGHRVPGGLWVIPDHIEKKLFELLQIREEPGWTGAFSRRQFPGALANGTRVRIVGASDAKATVLGSVMRFPWESLGYFLELDQAPRHAEFVPAHCIEADAPGPPT